MKAVWGRQGRQGLQGMRAQGAELIPVWVPYCGCGHTSTEHPGPGRVEQVPAVWARRFWSGAGLLLPTALPEAPSTKERPSGGQVCQGACSTALWALRSPLSGQRQVTK